MSCAKSWRPLVAVVVCGLLAACGGVGDDLVPSDSDRRDPVVAGSIGPLPGQTAADFTLDDSLGTPFQLADYLDGGPFAADAVVLYFTMWCPICISHTDHLLSSTVPEFRGRGTVVYALVDYVSGELALARASEQANGYAGSDFVVLADVDQTLFDQLNGAMGTVVVIGGDGVIRLNEDYRTGANLATTLDELLP